MLTLTISGKTEFYDESTSEFVSPDEVELQLEHSLLSLSKWESKFEKPFINSEKTLEEMLWYIRTMTITPDVPQEVFDRFTEQHYEQIQEYINSKQTATWFSAEENRKQNHRVVTAEVMYYWMFSLGIDRDFENRHLNHFLVLVRVFNKENAPKKKMSPRQIAQQQRTLNEQRRAQMGTRG